MQQWKNSKAAVNHMTDRFGEWNYPEIIEGRVNQYFWMVQHKDNFQYPDYYCYNYSL